MLFQIKNFLLKYFWIPIVEENVNYNIFNTLAYSLIFGILAIYLGYKIIKKLNIDIDWKFALGISPYIIFAASLRSAEDIGLLKSPLFITPLIFFILIPLVLSLLFVGYYLDKKFSIPYHKFWFLSGLILTGISLSLHSLRNYTGLLIVLVVSLPWIAALFLLSRKNILNFKRFEFSLPIAAHLWDATVSFTAIKFFPFIEEHVLASFLVEKFGPVAIFPMKILIIVPITYFVWNEVDPQLRNYVLFLIALFGFGIGTRNLITLLSIIP